MTTKPLSAPALTSFTPALAFGTFITSIGKAFALYSKYRQRQRDYEQLLSMPKHQLRDIGLTRDSVLRAKSESLRLFGH